MTSMIFWPFLEIKTRIAITAVIAAPTRTSKPKIAFKPSPAPAIFPILKANPPNAIRREIKVPKPLTTSLAISWPR